MSLTPSIKATLRVLSAWDELPGPAFIAGIERRVGVAVVDLLGVCSVVVDVVQN